MKTWCQSFVLRFAVGSQLWLIATVVGRRRRVCSRHFSDWNRHLQK